MKAGHVHITLDEAAFRKLVSGEIVEIHDGAGSPVTVRIILSDIGFDRMAFAVARAMGATKRGGRHGGNNDGIT